MEIFDNFNKINCKKLYFDNNSLLTVKKHYFKFKSNFRPFYIVSNIRINLQLTYKILINFFDK